MLWKKTKICTLTDSRKNFTSSITELPEPPKDCVLRNRSESEGLEVACIPGFDGDLPQHFLLEVSESPSVKEFQPQIPNGVTSTMNDEGIRPRITGPPIYIELGAKPVFMLHSLEAGKDYELAVFARNDWGKSDPPVIIPKVRVTTAMEKLTGEVSEEAESGASTQPMAVVLGVIVAAAFLILGGIFVTAGLVICKRRSLASQGATAPSSRPQQFPLDELLRESPPKTSLEAGCVGGMYHDEIMNVMVHVPAHVSRVPRADVVMPRMRLRNEASEKESQPVTRTSIVEDEGGGGNSVTFNHRSAHNEPPPTDRTDAPSLQAGSSSSNTYLLDKTYDPQPGTSFYIRPEDVSPVPRVSEAKRKNNARKKGYPSLLSGSHYKNDLLAEKDCKEAKHKEKAIKRKIAEEKNNAKIINKNPRKKAKKPQVNTGKRNLFEDIDDDYDSECLYCCEKFSASTCNEYVIK
uniref:Uncharacterized protein n=1 Tax=Timema monikensis TaxID=170555 RepID=A0A7R9HI42_9NEOP|nr:unnamed protein product [Timema monikensis]